MTGSRDIGLQGTTEDTFQALDSGPVLIDLLTNNVIPQEILEAVDFSILVLKYYSHEVQVTIGTALLKL